MIKDSSKYFYICDGKVLKSLGDLKKALASMPDDVYNYHASRDDFAKWVAGVLNKKALAKKISGANKQQALQALGK
ncbi:MAG: hypothetical protein JXB14_04230 [Candidatus Altiarchaeota archaeon]|nr:hypothetical protein [Candidatus Altiarchaeota archaeon]